ncbi:MAG TPA: hypothetical protein DCE18_03335 [Syntrophobacteraceae bacterium]|nr:hypothetical protein [Syntrophobacteraceae bacterium]
MNPSSNAMVGTSMDHQASSGWISPVASRTIAPRRATPGTVQGQSGNFTEDHSKVDKNENRNYRRIHSDSAPKCSP